ADAVGLAALEGRGQLHGRGLGDAAPHWQRYVDLVEIDDHLAEVLVPVRGARGPARRTRLDARRPVEVEAAAVAIQVVTGCRRETQQHGVAVAGNGLEAEGLLRRQRQRLCCAAGVDAEPWRTGGGTTREAAPKRGEP